MGTTAIWNTGTVLHIGLINKKNLINREICFHILYGIAVNISMKIRYIYEQV
jgi:hypothetical protein